VRAALRIILLLIAVAGAAGGFAAYRAMELFEGPGPLREPATVVIEPGEGPRAIAERLLAAEVIDNRLLFLASLRISGDAARLKAGEFAFPASVSMQDAVARIVAGRTVVRRLTVPEGLTTVEILELLEETPGLEGAVRPAPEGVLLPETYHFHLGDKRWRIVQRMRQAMREAVMELWPQRAKDLPVATPEEAIILASIVEKETGVAAERARVAAVFINRLRIGMRLQSDPTVIYALTQGKRDLGRPLTRADWKVDSPYNTYRISGLPPTPIANPGRAAIAAVLNPLQTNELYFVADGSGGHAFAETLDEHNRNVRRWRKLRNRQN
jgi:UPF0755 protein